MYAVAWSPDGKHLAAAGVDKSIRVWQANADGARLVHSVFAATRLLAGSTKSDMATHCIPGAQPAGEPSAEAPSERDREASEWAVPPPGTERLRATCVP